MHARQIIYLYRFKKLYQISVIITLYKNPAGIQIFIFETYFEQR
jgi:hypothetical protein